MARRVFLRSKCLFPVSVAHLFATRNTGLRSWKDFFGPKKDLLPSGGCLFSAEKDLPSARGTSFSLQKRLPPTQGGSFRRRKDPPSRDGPATEGPKCLSAGDIDSLGRVYKHDVLTATREHDASFGPANRWSRRLPSWSSQLWSFGVAGSCQQWKSAVKRCTVLPPWSQRPVSGAEAMPSPDGGSGGRGAFRLRRQ